MISWLWFKSFDLSLQLHSILHFWIILLEQLLVLLGQLLSWCHWEHFNGRGCHCHCIILILLFSIWIVDNLLIRLVSVLLYGLSNLSFTIQLVLFVLILHFLHELCLKSWCSRHSWSSREPRLGIFLNLSLLLGKKLSQLRLRQRSLASISPSAHRLLIKSRLCIKSQLLFLNPLFLLGYHGFGIFIESLSFWELDGVSPSESEHAFGVFTTG